MTTLRELIEALSNNKATNSTTEEGHAMNDMNMYSASNMATVRQNLAAAAGVMFSEDTGVARHENPANLVSLPNSMSVAQGAKQLAQTAANLEEQGNFRHIFKYRYEDGAYATSQVMREAFGTLGRGKPVHSFFGTELPSDIDIAVGIREDGSEIIEKIFDRGTQVDFQPVEGTIAFTEAMDPELGRVFALQITCPKKFEQLVKGFWNLIEDQLAHKSIYKGKSWRNVTNPKFLSLRHNDTIVYNQETYNHLKMAVLDVLDNQDLTVRMNENPYPNTLLYGQPGTGKTEFGLLTAEAAERNGFTFILHDAKAGIDGLKQAKRAAEMYAPAVLFIEDFEQYIKDGSTNHSEISNLVDGADNKSSRVLIVMTTNYEDAFTAASIRPGRTDHMIHVTNLDRVAQEQMMRRVIAGQLAGDVDFDAIYEVTAEYPPAFIRATFSDAKKIAAYREKSLDFKLTTTDLVTAAIARRPQFEIHQQMLGKVEESTSIETALREIIGNVVRKETLATVRTEVGNFRLDTSDGELMYEGNTEKVDA